MSNTISHWFDNKPFPGNSGNYRAGDESGDW